MSDEVVPSCLLTRRGVPVVFLLSVLHMKCSREVSFGCCVIFVCLLVHDTRICCIKAQSLLPAEFQSDLFLSSMSCWTYLNPDGTDCVRVKAKCDTHCELLEQWTTLTSQKVVASQIPSARIINTFYIKHDVKGNTWRNLQKLEEDQN